MKDFLRRMLRNPSAVIGGVLCLGVALMAVFGPLLAPADPEFQSFFDLRRPPLATLSSGERAWLGTDGLGRDIFSRILHGGRVTLSSGVLCLSIALVAGTLLGALAGYWGGWIDLVVMRVVDLLLTFPSILLAILLVAILGPSLQNAILAVSVVLTPQFARLMRAVVLEEREKEYVHAARALGAGHQRILWRTIFPNTLGPMIVQATMGLAICILDTSGLSFLGMGAQPPSPEWGAMLFDGLPAYRQAPWVVIFPGLMIFISVLGINLLGDGLRAVLDPRLRS